MKKFVIIVAGGSGTRMNAGIPKQFLILQGKPVLAHSIEKFHLAFPDIEIIVVLPVSLWDEWDILCKQYNLIIKHTIAPGGETRFHSVQNGLELIAGEGIVAIHDAARPLISTNLISSCMLFAEKHGNAIPVIPVNESIRQLTGDSSQIADRDQFRIIQTPQCFSVVELKGSYKQGYKPDFTDDASVLESAGYKINLVQGEKANLKITVQEDLLIAGAILKSN